MDERINIVDALLDDNINIIDVETASSDICGYENGVRSGSAEVIQDVQSLVLHQVTM